MKPTPRSNTQRFLDENGGPLGQAAQFVVGAALILAWIIPVHIAGDRLGASDAVEWWVSVFGFFPALCIVALVIAMARRRRRAGAQR